MPTVFAHPIDNLLVQLSATPHVVGDHAFVLATGGGAQFGTLPANRVWRVTAFWPRTLISDEILYGVFDCTGRTGDTLTGVVAAAGYTDAAVPARAYLEIRPVADNEREVKAVVNTLEAGGAGGALVAANNLSDLTDVPAARVNLGLEIGVDVLAPDGDGSGLTNLPATGAPTLGTYIVRTATNAPTNAQVLASLATGLLKNTTTTGVVSIGVAGTDYLAPAGDGSALTGLTQAQISGLAAALALLAPLASPTFTGTPIVPTAAGGTNTTQAASTAYVRGEVAALVASAPGSLDTLKELADAINDDASFAATVTTALGGKQPLNADLSALSGLTSAADTIAYYTGIHTAATAPLSAFGRTLIDDASASVARATLGLVINTDVLAPNGSGAALTSLTGANVSGNIPGNAAGLTATLAIGSGGTGQTTANAAFNALAPSQASASGKYLTSDGTTTSWGTVAGGGASPGGAAGDVQTNDGAGGLAGTGGLNYTGGVLTAWNTGTPPAVDLSGYPYSTAFILNDGVASTGGNILAIGAVPDGGGAGAYDEVVLGYIAASTAFAPIFGFGAFIDPASPDGRQVYFYDGPSGANQMTIGWSGTAPTIGFLGASPGAPRAAAPTTLADVITILRNLGFCD